MGEPWKPTKAQLLAAVTKTVPDVIKPDLDVLFCGINPGLYTAAVGHHFARPGNRFWPAIHQAGFTPRLISPFDEHLLLEWGLGITNMVMRATATADQLTAEELLAGAKALTKKILKYRPRFAAMIGVGAYRCAFERKAAAVGLQEETIGETKLWVLPNPSGLNAHYQLSDLAALFRMLKDAVSNDCKK